MSETSTPRKLATIVALDVAGYSARTEADEARTTSEVAALRPIIEGIAARHGGRIFNTAGDGFMLEFGSSLAAVEAAFELAETCAPKVRVGVHVGDVVPQPNGDLLGHGVNVAARLMAKAEPGSTLISADVKRMMRGPIAEQLQSCGIFKLDKMTETIEAFALVAVATAIVAAQSKDAEPLLAVLPFDNLSSDPEMQFFSDGISEEILHTIARAKGLKVIGKTSSFQFRGAEKSVRKVVSELHATHVLDGSVRRAGNQIRVSAQLVEAASQTTLWSDRYDRELADVLKLQDEIATAIADALKANFASHTPVRQIDSIAYDHYLRARPLMQEPGEVPTREAAALLEQAVARAPHFAPAWAQLAAARALTLSFSAGANEAAIENSAKAAAERALALDPDCAEAYRALAMLKPPFSEHGEKIRLIEHAAALSPNDAIIADAAAVANLAVGFVRRAGEHGRRTVALEPLSPRYAILQALQLLNEGRADEAIASAEETLRRFPDSLIVASRYLFALASIGRLDEAMAMLAPSTLLAANWSQKEIDTMRGFLQLLREPLTAREQAFRFMLSGAQSTALPLHICLMAAGFDCIDLAYEKLFEALDTGRKITATSAGVPSVARAYYAFVLFQFYGDPLRPDPRFPRLCHRLGLVDYWRTSNRWPDCADEVPYDFRDECEKAAAGVSKP